MATPSAIGDGGLVPGEEQAVRAWLVEQGFEPGDLRGEKQFGNFMRTPMRQACCKRELNVCKWLYNHGAAEDISRANNFGNTPMHRACKNGHLSVCEWLYKVGAEEDISRANNDCWTPMLIACRNGHLSVCEWLYKVGADEDISRANNNGDTPMLLACNNGHLSVCEWLVLNGALNRPTSSTAADDDENDNDQGGHVDPAIVQCDICHQVGRRELLEWAQGVVNTHHTFLHVVLRGSVLMPRHRTSPRRRCHLPRLPRDELERVGSFVGVETGRRLRNAREFAEALVVLRACIMASE